MNETEIVPFEDIHPDVRRYLEHNCYCPNEIYDLDGFFYQLFYPEDPATLVHKTDTMTTAVVTHTEKDKEPKQSDTQLIAIWHDDAEKPGRIMNMQRIDATKNNIQWIIKFMNGTTVKGIDKIDEYVPGSTAASMNQIMSIADAVIVD